MNHLAITSRRQNRVYRISVSLLFVLQGLCFATWASRIPSVQAKLGLSDITLGIVLFALPVGSLTGLPLAGKLIHRFGSRRMAAHALFIYALVLAGIGLSDSVPVLVLSLVAFGIAGNISNIAINTQAVSVEAKYGRNIMASFHGLWSLAGFAAAGIGSLMIAEGIGTPFHFIIISISIAATVMAIYQYLHPDEEKTVQASSRFFVKPPSSLVRLGLIAFCCMLCEGAMFDWSSVYFQKVVSPPKEWIGLGYTAFMLCMALGRFVADWVVMQLGFKKTIVLSGFLIAAGLSIAVIFPSLFTAIIGFAVVGIGVSSVIPIVYSQAGKNGDITPSTALAMVSSIGFLGFLVGPPLIGLLAGLVDLRLSFVFIAIAGLTVALLALQGKDRK